MRRRDACRVSDARRTPSPPPSFPSTAALGNYRASCRSASKWWIIRPSPPVLPFLDREGEGDKKGKTSSRKIEIVGADSILFDSILSLRFRSLGSMDPIIKWNRWIWLFKLETKGHDARIGGRKRRKGGEE